jgi:hypothetical protein
LYNNRMKKKEIIYHLKGRWEQVKKREEEELKNTTFEVRFLQTASLMGFFNLLSRPEKNVKKEQNIGEYWEKIRDSIK